MSTTTNDAGAMRATDQSIEPVRKTREVGLSADQAFDLFTRRLAEWWPLATHSIGGDKVTEVRFEPRVGGRVIEVVEDGTEYSWADVLAWDPPHRFVISWHPNPEPVAASIVEVRFVPSDSGCTLELEHRGWEEFGLEQGTALRDQYGPGWDMVLAPFVERG